MVAQTKPAHEEASDMFSTKIRTIIIGLVASAGFAVASAVPAVSQAQWHNYCVAGHCTEHANYTYQNPCNSTATRAHESPRTGGGSLPFRRDRPASASRTRRPGRRSQRAYRELTSARATSATAAAHLRRSGIPRLTRSHGVRTDPGCGGSRP